MPTAPHSAPAGAAPGPTTRTLPGGVELPLVGYGTYRIGPSDAADAVAGALDAGYRHVDTAEVYRNEREVGEGLRRGMERNGLTRDDVVVTTKLWPFEAPDRVRNAAQVSAALDGSLERLGLGSVDLYLVHRPVDRSQRLAHWEALQQARVDGRARAVGVSNFGVRHLQELLHAGLPAPAVDQVELHPWSQKPGLVGFLQRRQVVPIAYSSLVPLSTWRHGDDRRSAKTDAMRAEGANSPFAVVAGRHGVTEAQVLLRWAVQQGWPVLPKSTDPQRVRQNLDLFGFRLDDDEMAAIAAMDRGPGIAWGADDLTELP